ncbi:MAG TPA: hypothetical protein PLF56_00270 [Micropruina sp.]|jgi:hypothetical protein|nr:hypothetical protein [Micropruina sp.]
MDWWGIGLIVAAGVAVVVYGYVDDRRKTRERDAAMLAPPKRDIPRFQPMAEAPAYLSELQARTRPDQLASTDLNALTRTDLLAAQAAAPSVTVGIAAKDFITDSPTGWAVAANPMVVVLSDEVSTVRELLPVLQRAQAAARPLVLVAPRFGAEVLSTLAANTVQGKQQCVPVPANVEQSERIAALTLARALSHTDLQAGWVPDDALGSIGTWISDRKTSWLIAE